MQHYFERREGTIPLGALGGALLQCDYPEPFSTYHCSPSPILAWLCSQMYCVQFILFTGPAHIRFAIFISSFCLTNSLPTPRTLLQLAFSSLHLCQVICFNGGPCPLPHHRALCCRCHCPCRLLPTSWSKILAKGVVISNSNIECKLAVYYFLSSSISSICCSSD